MATAAFKVVRVQESLNSEGLRELLNILKCFPLPWVENKLGPVVQRAMHSYSEHLDAVRHTFSVVCTTARIVQCSVDT